MHLVVKFSDFLLLYLYLLNDTNCILSFIRIFFRQTMTNLKIYLILNAKIFRTKYILRIVSFDQTTPYIVKPDSKICINWGSKTIVEYEQHKTKID